MLLLLEKGLVVLGRRVGGKGRSGSNAKRGRYDSICTSLAGWNIEYRRRRLLVHLRLLLLLKQLHLMIIQHDFRCHEELF